jgi:hypothetical protein
MSRPSSYKREYLAPHEVSNTAAPGGKLPVRGAKSNPYGGDWTGVGDGSPSAAAATVEHHETRAKPGLVAARQAKGK